MEYNNFLLEYLGLEDSLAGLFFPIEKLREYPGDGYSSDDIQIDWDVKGRIFTLYGKDSIREVYPDKQHIEILVRKMKDVGILRDPPTLGKKSE